MGRNDTGPYPSKSEINTIWSFTSNLWMRVTGQWNRTRPVFLKYGADYLYPRLMELIWNYLRKEKSLLEKRLQEVDSSNKMELRLLAGRVNSYMLILVQFIYLMTLYEDIGDILLVLNSTKGSSKSLYLPKNLRTVYPLLSSMLQRLQNKLY